MVDNSKGCDIMLYAYNKVPCRVLANALFIWLCYASFHDKQPPEASQSCFCTLRCVLTQLLADSGVDRFLFPSRRDSLLRSYFEIDERIFAERPHTTQAMRQGKCP